MKAKSRQVPQGAFRVFFVAPEGAKGIRRLPYAAFPILLLTLSAASLAIVRPAALLLMPVLLGAGLFGFLLLFHFADQPRPAWLLRSQARRYFIALAYMFFFVAVFTWVVVEHIT